MEGINKMNNTNQEDRRHFKRVTFENVITLSNDKKKYPCGLIDISLKGILIEDNKEFECNPGDVFTMELVLGENASIQMQVKAVRCEKSAIGFKWYNIDIDSLAHLRRLLEFNQVDSGELERELADLGQ